MRDCRQKCSRLTSGCCLLCGCRANSNSQRHSLSQGPGPAGPVAGGLQGKRSTTAVPDKQVGGLWAPRPHQSHVFFYAVQACMHACTSHCWYTDQSKKPSTFVYHPELCFRPSACSAPAPAAVRGGQPSGGAHGAAGSAHTGARTHAACQGHAIHGTHSSGTAGLRVRAVGFTGLSAMDAIWGRWSMHLDT